MDTRQAQNLALSLMQQHGITANGWRFSFDNAVRRLGSCRYGRKTITLSRRLTAVREEAEVRNTILHEIAHVLVGPSHGHDRAWQLCARSIGCTGERCSAVNEEVTAAMKAVARYRVRCPKCGVEAPRFKRTRSPRPKWHTSCGAYVGYRPENALVFEAVR
jgi:predicted SprT family Zn-dependent metalloprotease